MDRDLTNTAYLKSLLRKAKISPRRSSGQSFLVCQEVLEATLLAMDNGPQLVTELGAGVGVLTQALLAAGYKVRAIEYDRGLAKLLVKIIPRRLAPQLQLIRGDLKQEEWTSDEPYQLVGNIPYNLSGFILRRITQLEPAPQRVLLLVQREVGERITAEVPQMHLVSVAVQLWGNAESLLNVPATCFWPEPRVDSQLVLLAPHQNNRLTPPELEKVLVVAGHFFRTRRKQVGGTASSLFGGSKIETAALLKRVGIKSTCRPQEITLQQWRNLARYYEE